MRGRGQTLVLKMAGWMVLVALCGCAKAPAVKSVAEAEKAAEEANVDETKGAGEKRPRAAVNYSPGPVMGSAAELAAWLEETAGEKPMSVWLKIPVRMELKPSGFGSIQAISLGFDANDPLILKLDDSLMGSSLEDQLGDYCPEGVEVCELWVEGHWGQTHPLPGLDDEDETAFTLRGVVGVKGEDDEGLRGFVGR